MVAKTGKTQTQVVSPTRNSTRHSKNLLTLQELTKFREMLLNKKRELLGDINGMETEVDWTGANRTAGCTLHEDLDAEDRFGTEMTYGCIQAEAGLLREIEEALVRIEEGAYGLCMGTGQPIDKKRLQACPWAKYSIEYAKTLEKGRRPAIPIRMAGSEAAPVETGHGEDELLAEALADLFEQIGRRTARQMRRMLLEIDDG